MYGNCPCVALIPPMIFSVSSEPKVFSNIGEDKGRALVPRNKVKNEIASNNFIVLPFLAK